MRELTEAQIKTVEQAIDAQCGNTILGNELLDHTCCAIEAYMEGGHSFELALNISLSTFGKNEMKKVSKQVKRTRRYYQLKKQPLGWITPMMAIGLLFIVVNVGAKDRPDRKPTDKDFRVSSAFGQRKDPFDKKTKMHLGVDIVTPTGTSIVATADGVVEKVVNDPDGYGIMVTLKHDEGYQTIYAQLLEAKVKVGDKVEKGQQIALSGNSGRSTAPHLHYEVIHNGKRVDPSQYFGEEK
ncbi:M23 family metallopeptidase [Imperialibacter roseus]|uniref:M23 family metallopeptidase n=1 Tax=Imperialibacter roseus TaxID=1324217 RepID=A0ABZ0IWK1_9BACT|nr:M23 family metallopeptidase [Imperialibacter roseus]WOK08769.1 M23 family metallopeptidase [Imperialibacter roseus]